MTLNRACPGRSWWLGAALCALVSSAASATEVDGFDAFGSSYVAETAGEMVARGTVLGDIDGSGAVDFAIGSPYNGANGADSGRVYLFLNAGLPGARGIPVSDATVILTGEAGERLGEQMAGGRDLNGDGLGDMLVAAPGWNGNRGRILVFFGRTDWTGVTAGAADLVIEGDQADQLLGGGGVLLPGDINGDGLEDMVLSSPGYDLDANARDRGAVYLFLGNSFGWSTRTLITADALYRGDGNSDALGSVLAGLGDIDGDGIADWMVTAPSRDEGGADAGMAYLMFGGEYATGETSISLVAGVRYRGGAAGDLFGSSVAGGGDLNGDGMADIFIGAPGSDYNGPDSGRVYLIPGRRLGWPLAATVLAEDDLAFSFFGSVPGEQIGHGGEISLVDVTGDGIAEAFILADSSDAGGEDSGAAYVFLGRSSGWGTAINVSVADIELQGGAAGDHVGAIDAQGAGDLDDDGYADVLIGVPGSDLGGTDAGEVVVASQVKRWFDLDGDGYTPLDGDCDDNEPRANPSYEVDDKDGIDNDCDGEVDEDASGACDQRNGYAGEAPAGTGAFAGFGIAGLVLFLRRRSRQ